MLERRLSRFYSVLACLLACTLVAFLWHSFRQLDYDWDFSVLRPFLWQDEAQAPGLLLQGLWGTLWISLASILCASVVGTFVGLALLAPEPITRCAAHLYVDVFRNTPLLVQLYVMYFVIGTAFEMSPEQAGVLTLSLFCGAYIADILRGTLAQFDRGQLDAARAMGLSSVQVARLVVAPQALRRMLPPLVGQFVSLVKDSSLVSVISILELTKAALNVVSVSFRSFETWFFIAVLYFAVNFVVSTFGRALEARLSRSLSH